MIATTAVKINSGIWFFNRPKAAPLLWISVKWKMPFTTGCVLFRIRNLAARNFVS
jgi:hypothetical protein